ncbi:hypothetical protein [Vibrio taketomensis]|uniref:hypothetical protein n=1 Tax=Vibrio taketomensis TaxID=2572923 RepID=UPI0013896FB7|nr:hypothetical protein [Vibrio taketomensis]
MSKKTKNTQTFFGKKERSNSNVEIETVATSNENTLLTSYLTRISNCQFGVVIEECY